MKNLMYLAVILLGIGFSSCEKEVETAEASATKIFTVSPNGWASDNTYSVELDGSGETNVKDVDVYWAEAYLNEPYNEKVYLENGSDYILNGNKLIVYGSDGITFSVQFKFSYSYTYTK